MLCKTHDTSGHMTEPAPTKYQRTTSFTAHSAVNPAKPQPGAKIDQEFDAVGAKVADLVDFVNQTIDPDGKIQPDKLNLGSLQGAQGEQGLQGPVGAAGNQGPQGVQGPQGPQGSTGVDGRSYDPDAVGPTADRAMYDDRLTNFSFVDSTTGEIYFKKSNTPGDWSAGVPFGRGPQGPQGVQGIQGPQGPQGAQGNPGTDGTAGNGVHYTANDPTVVPPEGLMVNDLVHYQSVSDHILYLCTQVTPSVTLELKGSLKGDQGPQGVQGPQGAQGVEGPEGEEGPQGPQGAVGATGPEGPVGPIGPIGITPAGTIIPLAGTVVPSGFVKANGAALDRTVYANLFAAIGSTYGDGDGSTTFNVPDLRGEFVRGWDDGRGVDAGRLLGSEQLDAMQGHWHNLNNSGSRSSNGGGNFGSSTNIRAFGSGSNPISIAAGIITDGQNGTPRIADETRPRNVSLMYVIAY